MCFDYFDMRKDYLAINQSENVVLIQIISETAVSAMFRAISFVYIES